MEIKSLTLKDLESVGNLHFGTIPDLSSHIGLSFVLDYYTLLLLHPSIHSCFGAWDKDQLLGIITATTDMAKTKKILNKLYSIPNLIKITKSVILGKVSVSRIIGRLYFEYAIKSHFKRTYASILTVAVQDHVQRRGIGKALVLKVVKKYKKEKIKLIYVDTRKEFSQALSFYQHMGFKEKITIHGSVMLKLNISDSTLR